MPRKRSKKRKDEKEPTPLSETQDLNVVGGAVNDGRLENGFHKMSRGEKREGGEEKVRETEENYQSK